MMDPVLGAVSENEGAGRAIIQEISRLDGGRSLKGDNSNVQTTTRWRL